MINHFHNRPLLTQDEINKKAHSRANSIANSRNIFVLSDDPLFKYHPRFCPYRNCDRCGHDKYFLEYTYKCWDIGPKRMSHFGIIRCDKCGASISWCNKHLRDALIKKNNLNMAEID